MKGIVLVAEQHAEFGFTDSRRIRQHRIEHRLQLAGRRADDAQNFGGRRLLLQRFAELTAARLNLVEQTHVLDSNHGLVGKRGDQLDPLITLSTSAVAVCCSKDSRSSFSSRAFSIAITAWLAKVVTSSICFSVNGSTRWRARTITPIRDPSRSIGTPSCVRNFPRVVASATVYSGSEALSAMCTARPSIATRPVTDPRPGTSGFPSRNSRKWRAAALASGEKPIAAPTRYTSPSRRKIAPYAASQSRAAVSATVSRTGWRSNLERLMTFSTSLIAVWYSSDSVSSRLRACTSSNNRTVSMAITAWSAKVLRSSTCASAKNPGSLRATKIAPMTAPPRTIGTPRQLR